MQKKETKTMKRILACIMIVVMALTAVPLGSFVGLDLSGIDLLTGKVKAYQEGNYTYKLEKGEAIITGYNNTTYEDIVIPSSFDGYTVTQIGGSAFEDCKKITSVVIPKTVKRIGDYAFDNCTNMKSLILENGVQAIGRCAFRGIQSLRSVNIPNSVTEIGEAAFTCCYVLESVSLPKNIVRIEKSAFRRAPLKKLVIPDSVQYIGQNAFEFANFESVVVPENVTCIEAGAFGADPVFTQYLKKVTILNKNCILKSGAVCGSDITIYGHKNSTASTYAYDNGYKFVPFCTNGHNYTNLKEKKATTTQDGFRKGTCATCTFVENTVIPKVTAFSLSTTSYIYDGNVKTPKVTVKDSKGKTLKNGTDYTVSYASGRKSVGQYAVKITLKGNYSGSKTLYFNIVPPTTSKIAVSQTTSSIKATWSKVSGVTGYKVYLYKGSKLVKSVVTKNTSYTFTSLASGTAYKVYVKAYKTVNGKDFWSASKSLSTATKPGTPSLTVTAGTKKATLKWNKQTGATGYVVYMATSKTGKYSRIAVLKGNSAVSYTKTGLTKGKTYYFKVAAYKTVGSSNLYGSFSAVKAVKAK